MTTIIKARAHDHQPSTVNPVKVDSPLTLIIFGAAGDLTTRKLMPGLFSMFCAGLLPEQVAFICNSRRYDDDETVRKVMEEGIREHAQHSFDDAQLAAFLGHVHNHKGNLDEESCYVQMKEQLQDVTVYPPNHLFYLSVAPGFFGPIIANLSEHGLVEKPGGTWWTRVVIEKPFGRDLKSAMELNHEVLGYLDESQVYRIDHYLGKETVQNIMAFRFANAIFEPLFNSQYVDHIQISATETVGMEGGRGGYYDQSGAIRDMVQNHLLQLLCLVAMEPPSGLSADALRNEKVKVLNAVSAMSKTQLRDHVVRARYTSGTVNDKKVPGYLAEDRVDRDSKTETFLALRLQIDNWRWAGVPFYLRTGKRMGRRGTEIRVVFKRPPLKLFQTVECEGDVCDLAASKPNSLVFRIQPDEGISLSFATKRPAMQVVVEDVEMEFDYADTWNTLVPAAYERLLLDAMRGDSTLFTRSDEVEAAWSIIDPILQAWAGRSDLPLHTYPAGEWGPEAANQMFHNRDIEWGEPAGA